MEYEECIIKWGDYWLNCPDFKREKSYQCDHFIESKILGDTGYCKLKSKAPKIKLEPELFEI